MANQQAEDHLTETVLVIRHHFKEPVPIDSGGEEQTMAVSITVELISPFVEKLESIRCHDGGLLSGDRDGWRAFSHFHR